MPVTYVKAHGALANLAADNRNVTDAIARANRAVSPNLAMLAISGTELAAAGTAAGLQVINEVFADRTYLPNGRLVPRSPPDAMIHGTDAAAERLVEFLATGQMPTLNSLANDLAAQFICVHSDSEGAVIMAHSIRAAFAKAGIAMTGFLRWPDAYNAIRGFGLGQRMDHPALAVAFWLRVARYQLKIHRFDRIAMPQAPVRFPAVLP